MKKSIISTTITIAIMLIFSACGGKTTPTKNGKTKITKKNPQISAIGLTFLYAPKGNPKEVFLTGGFNGWTPDSDKYKMTKDSKGVWKITIKLDPDRYEYKFVVDGKLYSDPNSKELEPDGTGGKKSMVTVK